VSPDEDRTPFGQSDVVRLQDEDAVATLVTGAIQGLWEVVNQLTRLRRARRENFRVTIFGSARLSPGTFAYAAVKQPATELTSLGCDIVTGGGPGLMRAANEGAAAVAPASGERSVGVRIALPFEQEVNPFVGAVYEHRTFFSRLHHFMIVADAFVVVPGGIGTLLELSLAWQLLQVRKLDNVPLILVGEMWSGLVDWAQRAMLREDAPSPMPATSGSRTACARSTRRSRSFARAARRGSRPERRRDRSGRTGRALSGPSRSPSCTRRTAGPCGRADSR